MRLLTRLLLFSVPFGFYALFIYLVDPYNYIGGPSIVSNEVKMRTAYPLNYCLWKMPAFARHPSSNVLLGDSRMDALKSERVKELTGTDYFNLAYGGATLREIVESFWFASQHASLTNVYVGINFNLYTDYEQLDRTEEVLTIMRSPAFYFLNRTVLKSAIYGVEDQWMKHDLRIGVVTQDREIFWQYQLDHLSDFKARYVYPIKYRAELEKISLYAKKHQAKLVFVIFPTHLDLQNRLRDFGLDGVNARFKKDISSLAPTYDYDYPNEITTNKENFSDPYHCRHECTDEIIQEVWSGRFKYGRTLSLR